jgi:ABC-type xylose transport system substrate-binding protein
MSETAKESGKSLLSRLLDGAAEMVKRPFVERAVKRGFESATDSLDSQIDDIERSLIKGREAVVKVAQDGGSLEGAIQKLVDLQVSKTELETAKAALAAEKKAFLE